MSILTLPKELRLQIWALAYHTEPGRLVTLETLPHDEDHADDVFCPRWSPSPAPTMMNVCRESRAEAHFQAVRAGYVLSLPSTIVSTAANVKREFYFRITIDILNISLEGRGVAHSDDSPENGLLAHFLHLAGSDCQLRQVAISKVILHGFRDGSLSNVLRFFPLVERMVMMVPDDIYNDDIYHDSKNGGTGDTGGRERFVRAAARIVRMYKLDLMEHSRLQGVTWRARAFDVDFARLGRVLRVVDREEWCAWSDGGDEWATLDGRVDPFW